MDSPSPGGDPPAIQDPLRNPSSDPATPSTEQSESRTASKQSPLSEGSDSLLPQSDSSTLTPPPPASSNNNPTFNLVASDGNIANTTNQNSSTESNPTRVIPRHGRRSVVPPLPNGFLRSSDSQTKEELSNTNNTNTNNNNNQDDTFFEDDGESTPVTITNFFNADKNGLYQQPILYERMKLYLEMTCFIIEPLDIAPSVK